jgi:hypothetical protein
MGSDFQKIARLAVPAPLAVMRAASRRYLRFTGAGMGRKTTFRAVAAAPYNKRMQRTCQSVTHFAKRKMRATLPCR